MFIKKIGIFIVLFLLLVIGWYRYIYQNKNITNTIMSYISYDKPNNEEFYGQLEIPKIKLSKTIYTKGNENNNVNKNILLVNDEDDYIVLASHSGNSPISYFNKLDKLHIKDQVIMKINGRKRIYELFKKEYVKKQGRVKIKKYSYPILVLITCSKSNKEYQEIYYTRLKLSENFS